MIGVWYVTVTISQLTMVIPWKHVNSSLHPVGRYHKTRPIPPCAPLALADNFVVKSIPKIRCHGDLCFRNYYEVETT